MEKKKRKPSNRRFVNVMMVVFSALLLVSALSCSGEKSTAEQDAAEPQVAGKAAGENPLLGVFDGPFGVPPFDKIKVEHFLPAYKEGMKKHREEIDAIVNNTGAPTFANTLEALDYSGELLKRVDNICSTLQSANTSDALQKTAAEVSPLLSKHFDDIRLNAKLFERVKAVYQQKDKLNLDEEQKTLLEKYYKDFVRGGANLSADKQARLREINTELGLIFLKFGDNVLAEDNKFKLVLDKKEDLAGLPDPVISAAAEAAAARGHEGKWVFTLHKPSLIPFLQYSEKRDLREKMLKGYITRSDHGDELDNNELIKKIVRLRLERAKLLGYGNHAEYMVEWNMSRKPQNVYDLLDKIWKPALKVAKKEAAELQALIDKEGGDFKLQPWDWWYYAEKLKKEKYDLDENEVRPYFKLENVRDGVFYVATKLFGIKFVQRTDIPTYHPDVQVFEVQEGDGSLLGIIYLDYFPRASKRGGAWMNNIREQIRKDGKRIPPIVTNNGNFTKPTGDKPSLLSFDEVATLFHEFGHALHGLLSDCTYYSMAGTNVPIDFVELPSQIMENWVTEPEVLKIYARHYQTGEVIPQELIDKIKNAGLFNIGFATVEYMAACYLDMDWHTVTEADNIDVDQFEDASMNRIGLIPEIVVRYKSPYFRHVFSSGYSAGYYSYIWAEVLDADAFQAFKETSLFDAKTAEAFRKNVMEKGGSAEPMVLYKRFRGSEPGIDALLKRKGFL
jgi:peptidyl-dipeptidase Dcp